MWGQLVEIDYHGELFGFASCELGFRSVLAILDREHWDL